MCVIGRYFMMVVGLYATVGEQSYLLVALVSEKIIVRVTQSSFQLTSQMDQLMINSQFLL